MFQDFHYPHSAEVSMWLDCGEHGRVLLSRITPTEVVARVRRAIPPCQADLVVRVDGEEMRTRVNIANGFTRASRKAIAVPMDGAAPF
jgi:hypothetical protein